MKVTKLLVLQFFIVFLFLVSSTYSQSYAIDKGSMLISGAFSFSSAGGDLYKDSEDNNLVTMQLNTSIGYFISPGFNLGGKVLFARASQGDQSQTAIGIGPQVAYYFGDANTKTYPYIGASVLYVSNTYKSEYTDYYGTIHTSETTVSGSTIYFGGGVCQMLSKAIGLFGEIGYQIDNLSNDGNSSSGNKINLTIGIAAFLF